MKFISKRQLILITAVFVLFTDIRPVDLLSVMSVDLGSEFIKISIVKPGVPMEIVLNRESKRKTLSIVSMRNNEREFGEMAKSTQVRFPAKAYWYLLHVVGRSFDDPLVEEYRRRFPYYTLVKDEDRGTVLFQVDDETRYSPEELLAMILENAKDMATDFAEQPIKDAVITVPVFFNQAERRAVKNAAELAGLNVLQLMSDNAAVALNYGVFRRKMFNSTMHYIMFYDMGATSTTATIVGYQTVKMKEGTRVDSNPQLVIKGVGFDRTLGGLEVTLRLRDHFAKEFNRQKKTANDVTQNQRAMAKLFKEAGRVKMVISANYDHVAQVENLMDEKDFRMKVTREELDGMLTDLFDRVTKPVEDALKISQITLGEINDFILMGGGTRMPKVQEILLKYLNRKELGKSINTDEAAALGSVYQAAHLSQGFRVKPFVVKEGNVLPIVVEFERQKTEEDGSTTTKTVKRTLFGQMNPFPQKKVMTFNKHFSDFNFEISYGDMDFLSENDKRYFQLLPLANISLSGVADAHTKHGSVAENKGVKAHFRLDESGLLHLDTVEAVFEKQPDEAEEKNQSAWSKLGNTLSGFFSGTTKKDYDETETSEADKPPTPVDGTAGQKADSPKEKGEKEETKPEKEEEILTQKPSSQEPEQADQTTKEKTVEPESKSKSNKESSKADEKEKTNSTKEAENEVPVKPKPVVIKETIKSLTENLNIPVLSEARINNGKKRLAMLRSRDEEKRALEKIKNELEAFIFDMQDKLSQDDYIKCLTATDQESLSKQLSVTSDWLSEQPEDTKKEAYDEKMSLLTAATHDLIFRVRELQERPRALEALKSMLNQSEFFLRTVKNLTIGDDPVFTEVEVKTLDKLINDTYLWQKEMLKEQKNTPSYVKPKLLIEDIAYKIRALDREVNYLISKAKTYKPKVKPKVEPTEVNNKTVKDNATAEKPVKETADTGVEPPTPPTDRGQRPKKAEQEKDERVSQLDVNESTEETTSAKSKNHREKPKTEL